MKIETVDIMVFQFSVYSQDIQLLGHRLIAEFSDLLVNGSNNLNLHQDLLIDV